MIPAVGGIIVLLIIRVNAKLGGKGEELGGSRQLPIVGEWGEFGDKGSFIPRP